MTSADTWLLPDGIDELLPQQAAAAEKLRRDLLDCYRTWGYHLVRAPMLEFLESLKVGTGNDLALQTFTLTDQLSGRLLGLRADITPQVARMDAHSLKRMAPARLCYCAPVLHSIAANLSGARELDQIGIELFGSASVQADIEVIELMLITVAKAGAFNDQSLVKLDLGNVGIFAAAAKFAQLQNAEESQLSEILQRKALPELEKFINEHITNTEAANLIRVFPRLCGDQGVLAEARKIFSLVSDKSIVTELLSALDKLELVFKAIQAKYDNIECYFDLAELRGYDYHTGLVFAVYKQGKAQALALGGRYDSIGKSFGRSRPATGFSSDLRQLLLLSNMPSIAVGIFVPNDHDSALLKKVAELRAQGEVLVQSLNQDDAMLKKECCDRQLVLQQGVWKIEKL